MSNFPIQGPPKFIQIGNFWYENKPSGNPVFGTEKRQQLLCNEFFCQRGEITNVGKLQKQTFSNFRFCGMKKGLELK
jgi:hypothetical protein